MTTLKIIALNLIDEPVDAHRVNIDEQQLGELADSIRDIGLLNPIIVRPTANGRHEIIAGHRRYIAHRMLSRTEIECFVREANDAQVEQGRFAENLQREQLSAMEEAVAIDRYMTREGKNAKDTARALNRTGWWVTHRVALLAMPGELGDMVHTGKLAAGSALELAKVKDDKHRRYLLDFVVRSGASVAVVREWVDQWVVQQSIAPEVDAPLPEMPVGDQPIIITMPCYLCGNPHDYRQLVIVRVCRACDGEVKRP